LRTIRSYVKNRSQSLGIALVYVCLCNALTDRRVKQAIADASTATPCEVYAACGCRAQCGKCVKLVRDMLREHLQPPQVAQQGAG
jgi:bacterioferritin-associated ferredoxin